MTRINKHIKINPKSPQNNFINLIYIYLHC